MVAASESGEPVRGAEQGVDVGGGEKRDECLVEPFGWDGEHSLDEGGVVGVARRGELEQGVDRGEACVAGPHAVTAFGLQVVEERGDQLRVQIGEGDARGGGAGRRPTRVAPGWRTDTNR